MLNCDKLWINANLATINELDYGIIEQGAIAVSDGKIIAIGTTEELTKQYTANQIHDATGKWITPGLIDCHTHIVYAGNRSNEFEARLNGVSYADIAAQGGGIIASVTATRAASEDDLFKQALPRLRSLINEGVTTIEIKSGYGLDLENERKMLRVARRIGKDCEIEVHTSYLAAHALPPEFKNRSDEYVNQLCEWMKILHNENLIDCVDGFCEHLAFSPAQIERVFLQAKALGLPVKLHAEQLSNQGGAQLVASYNGLSADHLEYLNATDVEVMAKHGTVAVILPGAFYTLRETQYPPMELLREKKVPIALSTDCNPGTSPLSSLLLTMNMGCTLFAMTPFETLKAVTLNAAKALGVSHKVGCLAVGLQADFAVWDIERPADLSYLMGLNLLAYRVKNGEIK